MLVPADADFDKSIERLLAAGFTHAPWSYGSSADPKTLPDEEWLQNLHESNARAFADIDRNSVRLQFPDPTHIIERVVLVRSAYVHLGPPVDPASAEGYHLVAGGGAYCPSKTALLESFVRTLLYGSKTGLWRSTLDAWAISYTYGYLMIEDSALDGCEDERVRDWFNKGIRRWEGGMDRTTISKRVGRQDGRYKQNND